MKDTGNAAAHGKNVSTMEAATALREFFHVAYWVARTYGRGAKPAPDAAFSVAALPRLAQVPAATLAQLQEIGRRFKETVAAREAAEAARQQSEDGRAALEAEIKALQGEIAAIKAANQAAADPHDYARRKPATSSSTRCCARRASIRNRPTPPRYASPVCRTRRAKASSITCCAATTASRSRLVEAKRTRKDPRIGQQQAKLYADCLEAQYGQRPVIFYTNGYDHWIWDDTRHPPRPIQGFLHEGRTRAADPAPRDAQGTRAGGRRSRRSSNASISIVRSAAWRKPSSATGSARRWS